MPQATGDGPGFPRILITHIRTATARDVIGDERRPVGLPDDTLPIRQADQDDTHRQILTDLWRTGAAVREQ